MKKVVFYLIIIITILILTIVNESYAEEIYNYKRDSIDVDATTPVNIHGKLSVDGTNIVDENGNKFQLRGVSTHGLQWFPQYVNQEAFIYMRDEWGINAVRLAMYTGASEGYTTELHKIVHNGVEYAKNAGIYVIIDWHILNEGNPNTDTNKQKAIAFFKEMASKYKDCNNVIYEICNEPNGDVQWERDIKPYAQEIIKEIRKIDDDAIIVVGTPTWSQDVDIVAQSPITGYENIMYTLHFYAATHKEYLRQKATTALNSGLPIFATEFGICDASGNGNLDIEEANTWIKFLNDHNISWMCWNLSNKNESSSLLNSNTNKVTNWTIDELSDGGRWLLGALKQDNHNQDSNNNNNNDNGNGNDNDDNNNNDNNNSNSNNNSNDYNNNDDNSSDNNNNSNNNSNNNNNDNNTNNSNNGNDYNNNNDNSNENNDNTNGNSNNNNNYNNTNNNDNNKYNNNNNNGNTNNNIKSDNTVVNGNLPNTGVNDYIFIPICLITMLVIYLFIKLKVK